MFGEDNTFMGTEYYGGPLFEHRGKPDPAKAKAREEAHKRGLARSKNARRREKEAEERRKEREKKRKQREKELKAMGKSDSDIKKELEKYDKDFQKQEEKNNEENQLQSKSQQFSKEQLDDINKKHKSFLNDVNKEINKIEAKTETEKKLKNQMEDFADGINSQITDCIENGENFDVDEIINDASSKFEEELADGDYDADDFTYDYDFSDSKHQKVKKKKKEITNDDNFRDLQDDEAYKNKKINDINNEIQELKEQHQKEIDECKTDSERRKVYNRNKKKFDDLKDKLRKMEIKSREDYQDYKREKKEKRKDKFNNNPAVMFFRYNFYKFTQPFVKFARFYNEMYDYTTSNVAG